MRLFYAVDQHCSFDAFNSFTIFGLLKYMEDVLTERELDVLCMRYVERKTLEECSQKYSVSREFIHQLEDKAFEKLNDSENLDLYMSASNSELNEIRKKLRNTEKENRSLSAIIKNARDILSIPNEDTAEDLSDTILLERMRLSLRSYNALKNAGCETLKDVTTKFRTMDDFVAIKNLGVKSTAEIMTKVHEYGYKMAWEL